MFLTKNAPRNEIAGRFLRRLQFRRGRTSRRFRDFERFNARSKPAVCGVDFSCVTLTVMAIRFYSLKNPYGEFSNFSPHPFDLDGESWPTSEAYFQACKFEDRAYREQIRLAPSPMKAANLGRSRSVPLRTDWNEVKDDAMRRALKAKFAAHPQLRSLLLSTGDEPIIEATTGDLYWGCGTSGDGLNRLGELLVELRAFLRAGQVVADEG